MQLGGGWQWVCAVRGGWQWVCAVRERVTVGGGGAIRGRVAVGVCNQGAGDCMCSQGAGDRGRVAVGMCSQGAGDSGCVQSGGG